MKQVLLLSLLLSVAWACPGPTCPGGCCPIEGYVCCNDGIYCAATQEYCPPTPFFGSALSKVAKLEPKAKLIKDSKCSGPTCPGGCCPEEGYVCCNDGMYCAATQEKCPPTFKTPFFGSASSKVAKLEPKAKLIKDSKCSGPTCPGGCCPEEGYVCCNDGMYCASTTEKCPETKMDLISRILPRFSPRMTRNAECPGVWCPSGCCSQPGYVCCVNQQWCAQSENECPSF